MGNYLNLVSYFGGKFPHLKFLINLFPRGNYHFVDMMCGAANVALNVNYPLITVNDINDEIINLFYVLRERQDEFLQKVYFTPFSRREIENIVEDRLKGIEIQCPVERARRYFARCQLGYGANGSQNNHKGTGFEYSIQASNFYKVDNWNLKIKILAVIADRLRTFQIESRDSLELFDRINRAGVIAYFDPPYLLSTRKFKKRYMHEHEDDFHIRLSEKVKNAKCYVAISGLDSPLYRELFPDFIINKNRVSRANNGKIPLQECLWTNYDPKEINGILTLKL